MNRFKRSELLGFADRGELGLWICRSRILPTPTLLSRARSTSSLSVLLGRQSPQSPLCRVSSQCSVGCHPRAGVLRRCPVCSVGVTAVSVSSQCSVGSHRCAG